MCGHLYLHHMQVNSGNFAITIEGHPLTAVALTVQYISRKPNTPVPHLQCTRSFWIAGAVLILFSANSSSPVLLALLAPVFYSLAASSPPPGTTPPVIPPTLVRGTDYHLALFFWVTVGGAGVCMCLITLCATAVLCGICCYHRRRKRKRRATFYLEGVSHT